jgi:catechol 2,3-dioxygenase-like lactoylglutathione lyase family enzyme
MNEQEWSPRLPVAQVRIARGTNSLQDIMAFYGDGLGLQIITEFQNHDGYSGIVFGLPGVDYHLEFTQSESGIPMPPPSSDDSLLVLYIPEKEAIGRLVVKLGAMGYFPTAPANPYWEDKGVTIEDPDGYRLVLIESRGVDR